MAYPPLLPAPKLVLFDIDETLGEARRGRLAVERSLNHFLEREKIPRYIADECKAEAMAMLDKKFDEFRRPQGPTGVNLNDPELPAHVLAKVGQEALERCDLWAANALVETLRGDRPPKPWIGTENVGPVREKQALALGMDRPKGVRISLSTDDNSPVKRAGVQGNDIITAIDGKPVNTAEEFNQALAASAIGRRMEITFFRNGAETSVFTTARRKPCLYSILNDHGIFPNEEKLTLEGADIFDVQRNSPDIDHFDPAQFRLYQVVPIFMRQLRERGVHIGFVTTKVRDYALSTLEHHGLLQPGDVVYARDETERQKDFGHGHIASETDKEPAMRKAMEHFGITDAKTTWMIGDVGAFDMEPAIRLGCTAIAMGRFSDAAKHLAHEKPETPHVAVDGYHILSAMLSRYPRAEGQSPSP